MSESVPRPTGVRKRTKSQPNEGSIVKTRTRKTGGQSVDELDEVDRFIGEDCINPAYVTIGGRVTKNLGNYESVQISVSVTLPCIPSETEVIKMREKASTLAEQFMEQELESLDS